MNMLILLHGEDTFRLKEKLREIVQQYQAKHKSGLDLSFFKEDDLDFSVVKAALGTISMFSEKKLIILHNIFNDKKFLDDFTAYVKKSKLKNNQEVIAVVCQEGKSSVASLKRQASMSEEFKTLKPAELAAWLRKRVREQQTAISAPAVNRLAAGADRDLWRLNNELNKLICYKTGGVIGLVDVELLVKDKVSANIFALLDAMARKDSRTAVQLLYRHLAQGDDEFYLFTMLIYQMRNLLKLKDLIERKTAFGSLAKRTGLHPFVVKKTVPQLNNFSLEQLKNIYRRLLEIDVGLKTGRMEPRLALSLLAVGC